MMPSWIESYCVAIMGKTKEMADSEMQKPLIAKAGTFPPVRSGLNFTRSYFEWMSKVN